MIHAAYEVRCDRAGCVVRHHPENLCVSKPEVWRSAKRAGWRGIRSLMRHSGKPGPRKHYCPVCAAEFVNSLERPNAEEG